VHLPRVDDSTARKAAAPSDSPAGGSEVVLLVEDEAALRAIVAETLRMSGYEVLEAGDPAEGLALAARSPRPLGLVITDVVLPGQSGPEMALQIRKSQPGVRILLISGYPDRASDASASIEPGTPFLGKPFTIDTLLRKVREVLGPPSAGV
jgi:two-component system, cell cycle sensor histidine kinase and response regulator CckA